MRILTYSPSNNGGGSIVKLIELITGLAERGWSIDYVSPKDFKQKQNINHYSIKMVPYLSGIFYLIQITIVSLYLLILKRRNIDRIITFSLLEGAFACILSFFSNGCKVIVALHGDWYTGLELSKKNKWCNQLYIMLMLMLEKFVFYKSDLVIFVSRENCNRILSRVKTKTKTEILYNNINSSRVIMLSQCDTVKFKEDKIIGFVGNLFAKDKGVEVLIRAFEKILLKTKDIRLVIVGDGPDKKYLFNLCKSLNLEADVTFTGFLENPFPYIKSFDIFVLPSLHEGFNLSILEALYCDKVVIGSKIGGIPEALVYDELLFNPKDIEELSLKICNLLTDKNLYDEYLELCKNRKEVFMFNWIEQMENLILM